MCKFKQFIVITISVFFASPLFAQNFSSAWLEVDQQEQEQIMGFAEEFKDFMTLARSELWFVREGVELAEAEGFQLWTPDINAEIMLPGSRWYTINRDRTLVLFIILFITDNTFLNGLIFVIWLPI